MIKPISLTDFVDFVVASGSPKLTVVRRVKRRGEYAPAADFWKKLREAIQQMHAEGLDRSHLDGILTELTHQSKVKRYPPAVRAYKKFLGRKDIEWFQPPHCIWASSGLEVRVNPELGLIVNGENLAIKLYFKRAELTRRRVETALELMHTALPPASSEASNVAVLDVPKAKLFRHTSGKSDLGALLAGEAVAFATIWDMLPE